jgi:release factor glutamine methyltransferase
VRSGQSFAGQTVESARRSLTARFTSGGIDSAELDARLLIGAVLGLDFTGMIIAANRLLSPEESTRLEDFVRRRLGGEPVARILGTKEFWGLPLKLSAETLVPRPDTETVVELALEMLRANPAANSSGNRPRNRPGNQPRSRSWRVADLGTGSGAILLALLRELPDAHGFGTDISMAALQMAQANAADLGLADRATFIACDYAAGLDGPFDLIVSNPPYIRTADITGLAAEVRDHDPRRALDGGTDGLDAYRTLIPQAARLLVPGGALVVESGQGQSGQIEGLITAAGLTAESAPRADLAGIPRAVAGRKMPL